MGYIPSLSTSPDWSFRSLRRVEAIQYMKRFRKGATESEISHQNNLPFLNGITCHYVAQSTLKEKTLLPMKRKGWQRPGPGPKHGRKRVPSLHDVYIPVLLAVIHLSREAIHFQQLYSFQTMVQEGNGFDLLSSMTSLTSIESMLPISTAMKKCIWPLTHQLGVPAFLLKLKSPYHAIADQFIPDKPDYQWFCSLCRTNEVYALSGCVHCITVHRCIEEIATKLGCTSKYLICSMVQSAAFHHIPELSSAGFYGFKKKLQFAVIRNELNGMIDMANPVSAGSSFQVLRRITTNQGWACLNSLCSGVFSSCSHQKVITDRINRGVTHIFSTVHELTGADQSADITPGIQSEMESADIEIPRYSRPLVPSEAAFRVDSIANINSRNNEGLLLRASESCHCGRNMYENASSAVFRRTLRVESLRCFVNYQQEIWFCANGHCVTPQDSAETREGLLWVSKDTAFTEIFLFEMLLHMTLAGATISSQSDIRSQILFLQTNYIQKSEHPRGANTVRRALITYAMAVVKSIPAWVFRCSRCVVIRNGNVYYKKLSFDGQQLGFNIRKDVRYDFYGKPSNPWRRPVDRNADAAKLMMMIDSRHLRQFVTEVPRVRDVPPGCNAVQALCRAMIRTPLRTKDSIRAAIAAIKLFDTNWTCHVPHTVRIPSESGFQAFTSSSHQESFIHPLPYITNLKSQKEFARGMQVVQIFREVLDCTAAEHILSSLLDDLRSDLKAHIPPTDRNFLSSYNAISRSFLTSWLLQLSKSETSWTSALPSMNQQDLQDSIGAGVAEHAQILHHPFRAPFSWKPITHTVLVSIWRGRRIAVVRQIGSWAAPEEAETAVLLFFMAILTESVTVWIRNGNLDILKEAEEAFRKAEIHCGESNTISHLRNELQSTHTIGLLYEGVMGLLGANHPSSKTMFATCYRVLRIARQKFDEYLSVMSNNSSRKTFMCNPKELDDMLLWTGAFEDSDQDLENSVHGVQMKNLYAKLAQSRSNDFLETGVWAPDFPIRRPSPSSATWANDLNHIETSCSKDFAAHHAFSPGTFGGYCLCRHAKTVMISFLKRPEGCRMPLNLIVERCGTLPKYVIYDFACGTLRASIGLSAEITKHVRFVIDPFHFPGHKTCNLAMHQANYSELKGRNVESQEQRNSRIKVMERTLCASRDVHFIHFVIIAHSYHNLKAIYLDHADLIDGESETRDFLGSKAWLKWIRDNLFDNPSTA